MQKLKSPVKSAVFAAVIVFFLSSCGLKTIGSGIVLWSPDEEMIATGSTVDVTAESEIEDTYTIAVGEETTADLKKWRIRFFESDKALEAYTAEYGEFLRMVGIAKIDSLAVRDEQDALAQRVYKLRQFETVKIIGRSAEKDEIGDYDDYWYKVLTKDGTEGWCYGESLIIQTIGEELDKSILEREADPNLTAFLENTWRPEYFRSYIDDNTIDLEEFRPSIGVFPDPEEQVIRYVTKKSSREYSYTEIVDAGGNLYLFKGTPVKVRVYTPERIMFEYLENGKSVQKLYLRIEEDIAKLVEQEQERRREEYNYLTEDGDTFSSTAYGTISFPSITKFEWTDYERLVPDVIPPDLKEGTGKLDFSLFLGDGLKQRYDGALLLTFTGMKEIPVALLYTRTAGGVQFVYAPESTRTGTVVEREPAVPIVMFFSVQGE